MNPWYAGVWAFDPGAHEPDQPSLEHADLTILPDGAGGLWLSHRYKYQDRSLATSNLRGPMNAELEMGDGRSARLHEGDDVLVTTFLVAGAVTQEDRWSRDGEHLVARSTPHGGQTLVHRYRRANVKQVIVYRRDLAMRKGKIAAQCAHASMAVFFRLDEGEIDRLRVPLDGPMAAWAKGRFAKVVLSVEGEAELLKIHELAEEAGLPCALITDSGKTEFRGVPTRTVVAIGPAVDTRIDGITGPGGAVLTKLA